MTGSPYGYFKVWDVEAGKLLKQCQTSMYYVWDSAFSADGAKLVVCSMAAVEIWDTKTWKPILHFDAPQSPPRDFAIADKGKAIVSVHESSPHFQLMRWNLADAKSVPVLDRRATERGVVGSLNRHALSPDGRWLAGTEWKRRTKVGIPTTPIGVWDCQTGKKRFDLDVPGFVQHIVITPENHLVAQCHDKGYLIWDLATGKKTHTFEQKKDQHTYHMAVSPHGEWLAGTETAFANEIAIAVWNTALAKREFTFGLGTGNERILAFSPSDRSLADGKWSYVRPHTGIRKKGKSWVELWEPYSGKERRRLAELPEILTALTFSPDGKHVAVGYVNGDVRVWDVASEKMLAHFSGHRAGISSLAYFPDRQSLASGSWDSTILIWKAAPKQKPGEPPTEKHLAKCWDDLIDVNAKTGYTAILTFADHPAQALPFLERKLDANPGLHLKQVPMLLANLDDPEFKVREEAFRKLINMGTKIRPAVEQALKDPPSVEAKRRLESPLQKLNENVIQPDELRIQRLSETLQIMGTPAAQKLLKRFLSI